MAKWLGQQQQVEEAMQIAMQEDEQANDQEAERQADYQEVYNEALLRHRNERKDISTALAEMDAKKEFREHVLAIAKRRHASAQVKYLVEKQRAIVAGLYSYNSELKAGL